jgi:hypothetical protein
MGSESYHERLAFAVVGAVLDVTVEPYDRNGRQRAVDAILHYADGRKAALEVSSISPDNEARIQHYLGDRGYSRSIGGVNGKWLVQLPRSFHPADMRKVEDALRQCEARGAKHLSELMMVDPDVDQLLNQDVHADLIAATGAQAYFVLPWIGGGSDSLNRLPHEVNAILDTDKVQSKVSKLAASGLEERHLFLIVLPTAFSYPVFEALAFGGQLPGDAPRLPNATPRT